MHLRLLKNSAFLILMLSMSTPLLTFGQSGEVGNWLMYFGQNRFSDELSLHTEVQYRNHTIAPVNIEQLLLRTGLNYHFAPNAFVTAGYGYITSYVYESPQSEPESREHRIWQQLITTQKLGRFKLEHRYRVEQRWVNGDFLNRLRYRLMVFVPLNTRTIEPGTVFLGVYDEIFANTEPEIFDRNRLYGAIGYQISPTNQVQLGLLNQYVRDTGKYYLQFGWVFNPDLRAE